jgi:hypothetical protein
MPSSIGFVFDYTKHFVFSRCALHNTQVSVIDKKAVSFRMLGGAESYR